MLSFRKVEPSDDIAIWAIFQEVVKEGTAFLADENVPRDEVLAPWFSSQTSTYIAYIDEQIVGAYMLKPNYHGRGSHVANATYMVHPSMRGRGLGRQLGQHSLEVARSLGFRAMQFNFVVSTNAAAVALWQSLGFTIIGTIPEGFRHPSLGLVDAYIMYRLL